MLMNGGVPYSAIMIVRSMHSQVRNGNGDCTNAAMVADLRSALGAIWRLARIFRAIENEAAKARADHPD